MTTGDFYIDKSKEPLIEAYRSRISEVFQVNIAVCHDEDKLPTKIFISSSDENCSSQNIKKAKSYLESLTADGDTVTQINLTLSQSHFAMVQELQSTIERDSQAVVDLSEDHSQVCIFGKRENVSIAQTLINRLKKDHGITPSFDLQTQSKGGYDDSELQEMPAFSDKNITNSCADFMQENVNLMKNDASENRELLCIKQSTVESVNKMSSLPAAEERGRAHSVLKRTVSVGTCPLASSILKPTKSPLTRTKSHGYGIKQAENCLSNSKLSLQLSTSSDDETTDEEEYNTKIEFALKLGYSELQLALVLEKLGNKAGQNEILSELIKLSTCSDGGNFRGSDEGAVERLSQNLVTFQLENCFELSDTSSNFRPIVIDGSNVAMSHGNKEIFSCRGIQLAVDWFKERGHNAITVFVPQWRKETSRSDAKITDQEILCQLEKDKILVFTPARRIGGKRVVCYDDRYILNLAVDSGGIVVSNDNYRDLVGEKPEYRRVVEERLLMYSFVNDRFMPPDDPLGRHGPSLDNFLSKEPRQPEPLPPVCPYGSRKCTYGNKCKFYHPERGNIPHKMVTEKLAEQAKQKIQEVRENRRSQEGTKSKQPLCKKPSRGKTALSRTQSLTPKLYPDGFATDTSTKRHSGDFGDVSFIKECRDTENDDKWKCYNDKLSEHRKQVEQADIEHQRQRSETMESQFNAVKTQNIESFTIASKIEHCGSRSSSPMQRSTPSPQLIQQQEVFLSGHLMLAKKLSDEAGETKAHKAEESRYNRTPPVSYNSPLATQVKEDQSLTQHSSVTLNQHLSPPSHQPVSQQFSHPVPMQHQHQKLSRQYSLQGPHDPRLQQRQMPSGAHSSRMPFQQDNAPSSRIPFQRDNFGAIQLAKNPFGMGTFSNLPSQFSSRQDNRFMGEESEHAALARMQSAPETIFTRTENNSNKRFGRMVRQNSSSDTQIHLLGEIDLGPNEYSLFPSEDMELNRGNQVNPQLSSGMNIQHMDLRQMKTRAVGYSKREYRSQHDNGETKWTFEPVLEHGSAYRNHCTGIQGIDAFESDYPPTPPWQDLKYPLQEHYQCQNQPYGLFQESGRPPFSQHSRNVEQCHPERFRFQNQTSSNLFSTSNYCESQQHSMLQNPSCKQNIGVIGQEHKQNLSRTSSACMGVHAPSNQPNSTMNPIGATLIDTGGNQPKFTDFPPIKPSDNRYNLYYHLCGLFPEPKVRKVMNDHPEETSPQVLCAHIIGM